MVKLEMKNTGSDQEIEPVLGPSTAEVISEGQATSRQSIDALIWGDEEHFEEIKFAFEARHCANGLFLGLLPSLFDVFTDTFSAKRFIRGDFYMKTGNDSADFAIENCTAISKKTTITHTFDTQNTETVTNYARTCWETDPIFGWIVVFLIFLPGLYVGFKLMTRINQKRREKLHKIISEWSGVKNRWIVNLLLGPPCLVIVFTGLCLLFPLLTILLKMINMFTKNRRIKALTVHFASLEGICESRWHIVLQLFMVFTLADRHPSNTQLASLVASVIMVSKTRVAKVISQRYTQKGVVLSLEEEIGKSILLLPVFASRTIGVIGSVAAASSLLRYNYVWFIAPLLLITGVGWCLPGTKKVKDNRKCVFITTVISLQFLLQIILQITANLFPNISLPQFYPVYPDTYTLSSMPLVANIDLLNMIFSVIMGCQLVSGLLYYFQIYKPNVDGQKKGKGNVSRLTNQFELLGNQSETVPVHYCI